MTAWKKGGKKRMKGWKKEDKWEEGRALLELYSNPHGLGKSCWNFIWCPGADFTVYYIIYSSHIITHAMLLTHKTLRYKEKKKKKNLTPILRHGTFVTFTSLPNCAFIVEHFNMIFVN